jgi:hypothetical protein
MEYSPDGRSAMALVVECGDCGTKLRFADSDEGQVARCRECGASVGVSNKSAGFIPTKKRKKKRKPEPNAAARLTELDRKEAIRAGQVGARILLAALLANLAAFVLLVVSYFTISEANPTGRVPSFVSPLLGLFSNACLISAMFRWRKTAAAIERGQVVQVGMILCPILFAVELARVLGVEIELVSWLATYGLLVYFTLLVVYLERVFVLAGRNDLQDLTHRVLSCGVGVIVIAILQQLIVFTGLFVFIPLFAILNVVMIVLWVVWCFEYFRLLLFAFELEL